MRPLHALLLACGLTLPVAAQQVNFNLDHLASKASNVVDLSLSGSTLQFAARFLDSKDPEEAKAKKLISSIEGIYVKVYQFKADGIWTQADLDRARQQLRAPEWSRIVGIKSEEGDISEVSVRTENKKVTGVAIIAAEPKQLTVVNIVGPVDLDSLADLGGHFGVPKLENLAPGKGRKLE